MNTLNINDSIKTQANQAKTLIIIKHLYMYALHVKQMKHVFMVIISKLRLVPQSKVPWHGARFVGIQLGLVAQR